MRRGERQRVCERDDMRQSVDAELIEARGRDARGTAPRDRPRHACRPRRSYFSSAVACFECHHACCNYDEACKMHVCTGKYHPGPDR